MGHEHRLVGKSEKTANSMGQADKLPAALAAARVSGRKWKMGDENRRVKNKAPDIYRRHFPKAFSENAPEPNIAKIKQSRHARQLRSEERY